MSADVVLIEELGTAVKQLNQRWVKVGDKIFIGQLSIGDDELVMELPAVPPRGSTLTNEVHQSLLSS